MAVSTTVSTTVSTVPTTVSTCYIDTFTCNARLDCHIPLIEIRLGLPQNPPTIRQACRPVRFSHCALTTSQAPGKAQDAQYQPDTLIAQTSQERQPFLTARHCHTTDTNFSSHEISKLSLLFRSDRSWATTSGAVCSFVVWVATGFGNDFPNRTHGAFGVIFHSLSPRVLRIFVVCLATSHPLPKKLNFPPWQDSLCDLSTPFPLLTQS